MKFKASAENAGPLSNGLVKVEVVARFLEISVRSVWRRRKDGTIPRPIKLGRNTRWDLEILKAWKRNRSSQEAHHHDHQ